MAKIGIMSFAHMHAYSYAACLKSIPGAELTAVWDDTPKRGKDAAAQFGVKFIKDVDAFLNSGLDSVIITSENVKHRAMVELAAKAGKWILCEKPLATTIEDAKAIVNICRKYKVGLGTAFPCRYAEPIIAVQKQIAAGDLGELYAASCTNHGQFPGGWFADESLSGGGATMDHTVHVVDLLRWITGKEFVSVYCENGNQFHPKAKTDDIGSLHLEMEGGMLISHLASWSRCRSFPAWGDVTMEIIGEKGVIAVDAFHQKLDVYDDNVMKAEWAGWGDNPDLGLVRDFVSAVNDRREPVITGIDGLRAVEVTVAACKSAATGKKVKI